MPPRQYQQSAWEWEPGGRSAPRDPDAGQPDLTRPVAAPVSSQAGCHRVSLLCTHRYCHASDGRLKKIHPLRNTLVWFQKNLLLRFISIDLSWKYGDCDIIVKCFLVKIAGTEMTEHPCLYLWWDSSGSVSTLLTSWKSQFTIYNLHYLGLVYICQSQSVIR